MDKGNKTNDQTVAGKPGGSLYGPQVIDVIMRKPGEIRTSYNWNIIIVILNRVFISDQILQLIVSEFNT